MLSFHPSRELQRAVGSGEKPLSRVPAGNVPQHLDEPSPLPDQSVGGVSSAVTHSPPPVESPIKSQ